MKQNRSRKWPFRVIALCLILAPLAISASKESANADGWSCQGDLEMCIYNCAASYAPLLPEYQACRAQCEMQYNSCSQCDIISEPPDCDGGYDFPEPWPVFANFSMCMDDCNTACNWLPLGERSACFVPCKSNCIETYGN